METRRGFLGGLVLALVSCMAFLFGTAPPGATQPQPQPVKERGTWYSEQAVPRKDAVVLSIIYDHDEPSCYRGVEYASADAISGEPYSIRFNTGNPQTDYRSAVEYARKHAPDKTLYNTSSVDDFRRDVKRRVGLDLTFA